MTTLAPASTPQNIPMGNRSLRRLLLMLGVAGGTGILVALGLYVTKAAYVALLPLGLALILPPLLVKDFRLFWFAIFLLSLQFTVSKNVNDGLAVIERLKIDYTIWDFTFDITATDIALLVLLVIWANDWIFHRRRFRFPRVTWLAVGYLGIALLSTVGAASPYLGLVEIWRQTKLFIVYLFTINCVDSKSALRVLAVVGVII